VTELRCADVEARFVDAVDGRLDPADSVRFHSHIEGCAACRERAALWRGLVPALRDAVPPGPGAMATRRMQVEIERQLAGRAAVSPARRWRLWWAPAFGLAAAAAAIVIWLRVGGHPPAPVAASYAWVSDIGGDVRVGEKSLPAGARIPAGTPIVLAAGGAVNMELDGGAAVEVAGPARFTFEGSASAVAVRLTEGKLSAQVTHRRPDETFAVITRHTRVEVRGTQFYVDASGEGTHVAVAEGRVAVLLDDGRSTLVSAGGSYDWHPPGLEPAVQPVLPPGDAPALLERSSSCADVARSCQAAARAIRATMRGGDTERALRMIADARRAARGGDASCPGGAGACDDELRYLHAEALNQAGRLDDAVAAYRALDRRGAPSAMRQNALYAAAQIERRQGRLAAAAADFELASAAAPRGALREDALVGAMESARAAGDGPRARALATRYLDEFPRGLGAAAARKLTSGPP
jgi:ferric-dicitrate binding protein FerR (iron transport regulator)